MNCRFCGKPLSHVFVDLGTAPPSNSFLTGDLLSEPEVYFPLKVFVCDGCFLVQIDEHKKSQEIFNKNYVYFSSTSQTWLQHSREYVDSIVPHLGLSSSSMVVEIASNDGYLLQYIKAKGIQCIGIEPTHSTAEAARKKNVQTIEEFFSTRLAISLATQGTTADLIIGNNVLAHVPDLNDFVTGMEKLLKPSGSVTLEFPHFLQLVENVEFDTIYHEHFSYFSFTTVCDVLRRHGLEVYDVEELSTHGGSLRVFAQHCGGRNSARNDAVEKLLALEKSRGISSAGYYDGFQAKVLAVKRAFVDFLLRAQSEGKLVAGYGAAAKGNTLLNYCGVRNDLVKFVVDAAASKQGRFLPGSRIPVVTEEVLRREHPDYVIVFPWNLIQEISRQLSYVGTWGGRLVTAIPTTRVISVGGC